MKMLLCRNKFTDKKVVYENIKALSKGIEHGESKLHRVLYGIKKKFVSEAWEVGWVDFVGYKRKERSDKAKRIEQMKKINLGKAAQLIKNNGGEIKMSPENRKKLSEQLAGVSNVYTATVNGATHPKLRKDYYDTDNVDRDDFNQDIQPIEGTKEEKIAALKAMMSKTKK